MLRHHFPSCIGSKQLLPHCASSFIFPCRFYKQSHLFGGLGFRIILKKTPGIGYTLLPSIRSLAFAKQDSSETDEISTNVPLYVNPTLIVESWGNIYTGPNESKYWNTTKNYPYPVGFISIKVYKNVKFRQTVKEGPGGPIFMIEDENHTVHTADSPQKVWNFVTTTKVHGARHFGFQSPEILRVLQAMTQKQEKVYNGHAGSWTHSYSKNSHIRDEDFAYKPSSKDNETDELEEIESVTDVIEDNSIYSVENEEVNEIADVHDNGTDVEASDSDDDDIFDDNDEERVVDVNNDSSRVDVDEEARDNDDDDGEDIRIGEYEDEEEDDDDDIMYNEEDGKSNYRTLRNTSFNVFTNEQRKSRADHLPVFSKSGPSLSNFKRSFKSGPQKFTFKRPYVNADESSEQMHKDEIPITNSTVYSSSYGSRQKLSLADKQIWRKGEGLVGRGASYVRAQGAERPGGDPLSSSDTRIVNNYNTGRTWEGSISKRKEDNSKSSQLLLELIQKWNAVKKWKQEPDDRFGRKTEEDPIGSYDDFISEDESPSINHVTSQDSPRGNSHTVIRSNSFSMYSRKPPGQELSQNHSSDSVSVLLDELENTENINESTDFAITKLFETVGKKTSTPSDELQHGKPVRDLDSVPPSPKDLDSDLIAGKGLKIEEVHNAETGLQDNKKQKESPEILEKKVDRVPQFPEAADVKNEVEQRGAYEMKKLVELRKIIAGKRYADALQAVRTMKTSGMKMDIAVYEAVLGFELDPWQKSAYKEVENGSSVLVCAPGGAGKSAVADCSLYRNVVEDEKALFVTPYESAADQNLHKFGILFGDDNVGGMWMKMRLQKGPQLVVITLEKLAKILKELNGPGGSEFRFFFEGINMVVLDKFHTFCEAKYGSLWEEVLMLLDSKIRVVALSLPVDNADQLSSWIDMNRGPCKLVKCPFDPIPKRYLFCQNSRIIPLLDSKRLEINSVFHDATWDSNKCMSGDELESFFSSGYDKPSLKHMLSALDINAMLPAIMVFFNVKSCNDAIQDALDAIGEGLLSLTEVGKVDAYLTEFGESHPDLINHLDLIDREGLRKGVATYHEGKLPVWQNFILKLFKEDLVKILIVVESILLYTEVFARTVIFSAVCQVTDHGVSHIRCNQFQQLIGRAGRRSYDIEGNVVFLKSLYTGPREAAHLALDCSFSITSYFKPSYSLIVNLMAKHKLSDVQKILGRSYADFEFYNKHTKIRKSKEIDEKILECLEAKADLELKLYQGLTEINKRKLADAAMFTRVDIRMSIHSASENGNALPGILLAVVPGQTETFYMVFGADNNFRLLPAGALDHVYINEAQPLDVAYKQSTGETLQPPLIPLKENWTVERDGSYGYVAAGNSETKQYVKLLMEHPVKPTLAKDGLQLRKEIIAFESRISNLIEKKKNYRTDKHQTDKLSNYQLEIADSKGDDTDTWKESLRLLQVLQKVDALSIIDTQGAYVKLKPLGMLISRLHNVENELWLASVVTSKYTKQLLPAEFITVMSTVASLEYEIESVFTEQREQLYRIPKSLKDVFINIEILKKHFAALQGSYTPPLQFDTALAGMVYAWGRAKPGTNGFCLVNCNDGDIAWKLRNVARLADIVHQACTQVSVDISEANDFNNLSTLARRAEDLLSRHLVSVDKSSLISRS